MTVKARTVGHSVTLTVPSRLDVSEGQEFEVQQKADGTIIYTPKHRNPFVGTWFNGEIHQEEEQGVMDSEWD